MRWQVEMTPIGKTDAQAVVVEAESWQKALQGARALRGESGPMSGFSIELLESGYRAVDPMARLVYVVKRAPDDAAITATLAGAITKKQSIPPPAAKPAEAAKPEPPKAEPPKAVEVPKKSLKQTIAFGSGGIAAI